MGGDNIQELFMKMGYFSRKAEIIKKKTVQWKCYFKTLNIRAGEFL